METLFLLLLILLPVIGLFAYIKALTNAAKHGKWTWFVLVLLSPPLFVFYYMGAYESGSPSQSD
jgi:hypothetical protein